MLRYSLLLSHQAKYPDTTPLPSIINTPLSRHLLPVFLWGVVTVVVRKMIGEGWDAGLKAVGRFERFGR